MLRARRQDAAGRAARPVTGEPLDEGSRTVQGLEGHRVAQLLARLLAVADDAVVIADDAHNIVLFNEGAEHMFGYAAAEVVGTPLENLLPPAARGRHRHHLREFARSQPAARRMGERGAIFGVRRNGEHFAAEASISHVEMDGRTYFTAFLRDVDQRQRAQQALADSEARFRALAESAPVGVFETDARGAITYVNACWCRLSGLTPAQSAGDGWLQALHADDRAAVAQAWQQTIAERRPFQADLRFVRADGSATYVVAGAVGTRDAVGTVTGYVGTVTDITEARRQADALVRAKAEAEAATRAKSLFLANISHEIRTPLNAVIGMTSLLLDTPMSDEQRDFAQTIRASSDALLTIINDILDYSKADLGKVELEHELFDLRACVEESLDLVTPHATEKRLNLAYLIEDGTPDSLIGDATRLRQILVNLLSNAVKFTQQGEVLATIDAQPASEGRWRVHFAVKDTGIGIEPEHLPRLFHSFSQVDPSMTRRFGGTGLGLAISKNLAALMGGRLWVDSAPGRGSVFHVQIEAAAGPPADLPHLRSDPPELAGKRILIVDDNLTNRRILVRQALGWGMAPTALPSALEALDRVRHGECFDVAVLDMSMPDMDGIELTARIRQHDSAARLPIVMLTSVEQTAGLRAPQAVGLSSCLRKPIKPARLYAALAAALGSPVLQRVAPHPAASPARLAERLPLRILVAEDIAMNQKVVLSLLRRLGYEADVVGTGLAAVEAVRRSPYDVVLMDVQMPEMDGVQAARCISRFLRPEARPGIIAMTAHAMPGDRETYLAAGMDGYIAKPIDVAELAAALTRAAARAGAVDTTAGAPAAWGEALQSIDPARIDHLRSLQDDKQPHLVRDLIDMFVADAPDHVDAITRAAEDAHVERVQMAAHRLLSITDNIGARRMSALCRAIERAARARNLHEAMRQLAPLQAALDEARAELLERRAVH
jgi:PAS domain S-box-containing protein